MVSNGVDHIDQCWVITSFVNGGFTGNTSFTACHGFALRHSAEKHKHLKLHMSLCTAHSSQKAYDAIPKTPNPIRMTRSSVLAQQSTIQFINQKPAVKTLSRLASSPSMIKRYQTYPSIYRTFQIPAQYLATDQSLGGFQNKGTYTARKPSKRPDINPKMHCASNLAPRLPPVKTIV